MRRPLELLGVEALVRRQHPTRGLRGPGTFLEVAQRPGLVVALGQWMPEPACRDLASWRAPWGGRGCR